MHAALTSSSTMMLARLALIVASTVTFVMLEAAIAAIPRPDCFQQTTTHAVNSGSTTTLRAIHVRAAD